MNLHFGRRHLVFFLICLCFLWMFDCYVNRGGEGVYRLDGEAGARLPDSFRLMTDSWHREPEGQEPTRKGLSGLRLSGSAEPSLEGVKVLYGRLRKVAPEQAEIYVIDCRQETHFYADGYPVSWHTDGNKANRQRVGETIEKDTVERMAALKGREVVLVALGGDEKRWSSVCLTPSELMTEREAAETSGFHYLRLYATDGEWPQPGVIDEFVYFLQSLPENHWLHFHCLAGQGRTTSFMCLYDIWQNPDVPVEDIAKRQYLLGGMNLFEAESADRNYAKIQKERRNNLRLFQKYVRELRSEDTSQAWSDWLKIQERPENMRRKER